MKKLIVLSLASLTCFAVISAQEVQTVVDITPDKPEMSMSLPTPPAEIKAEDMDMGTMKMASMKTTDLKTTTTPKAKNKSSKSAYAVKPKKAFADMTEEEQINYLEHKISKLRERSHKTNAKIHALERDIVRLQQELKDLKDSSNKTQGE